MPALCFKVSCVVDVSVCVFGGDTFWGFLWQAVGEEKALGAMLPPAWALSASGLPEDVERGSKRMGSPKNVKLSKALKHLLLRAGWVTPLTSSLSHQDHQSRGWQ